MAEVNLIINDQKVAVPEGSTILEAAQKLNIFIPTLCYDPELSRPASCRICVVEVKGSKNLVPSCAALVREGMVVYTDSPPVIEARKTILDLLLSNHPEDCLTCGRNGDCRLQDYAYLYGVRRGTFGGEKHSYALEDDNPFIVRDMNKCILCGKCVRMCAEVQGKNVVDFAYRGFHTKIAPAMDTTLSQSDCVFCGNCVAVCPVGALQEKGLRKSARTWEVKKVRTTCPYCGTGCNFDLNVKDGKVVGVTSCAGEVNGRALCVKGRFGYGFIHHPDRLTRPLIKKDGVLKE
ncbi:MAG: (2Fe-2S)-binding protein, partial [Moorella sp. (in: Bacteria)]|nr:(2Fe-2S)-binding protein [Moorella sp. (in: firmicutes)]